MRDPVKETIELPTGEYNMLLRMELRNNKKEREALNPKKKGIIEIM